ncbi:MAG: O-antigen ligase family protein [bacterium]
MKHLILFSDILIKCGVFASIFFIPVYFDTRLYNVFDLSKLAAMYILCLIILLGWVIKLVFSKEKINFGPLKWQVLIFFIISLLSVLFSINKIVSIFGYYRHYEGLLSLICYLILFLSIVSFFERKSVPLLVDTLLITGAICSLYGIVQHYRFDPFSWSGAAGNPNSVSSFFGNPAFFGGYITILLPIAFGSLLSCSGKIKFIFYGIIFFLICEGFFLSNRRACYFGLFFGSLLFLFLIMKYKMTKKALLISLIFFIPGIYYNIKPETSTMRRFLTTFTGKESAQRPSEIAYKATSHGFESSAGVRIHIWKDTLNIIKKYPIFGIGLDGLGNVYLKYRSMGVFRLEGDAKADSAHNEFLDIAVTRGISGLIIYLWLIGSFIFFCIKKGFKIPKEEGLIIFGIACGCLSYFIQTLFSFGVTPVFSTLWIVMGVACVFSKKEKKQAFSYSFIFPIISIIIGIFGFASVFSGVFFVYSILIVLLGMLPCGWIAMNKNIKPYISNTRAALFGGYIFIIFILFLLATNIYFADVHYKAGTKKRGDEGLKEYEEAVRLNPTIDWYQGEVIRLLLERAKGKRDPKYLEEVILRIKKVINLFPQDANNHNTLGLAYDFKGELTRNKNDKEVISCYKNAIFWNPFYVGAYNNIGVIYGRNANYGEAEKYFTEGLRIEPGNGVSLENLHKIADAYIFYKKIDDAKRVLTNIAKFSPDYPRIMEIYTNLGNIYKERNELDKIEEICLLMIKADKNNVIAHRNLGSIYFSQKKYKKAKEEFKYVLKIEPEDEYSKNFLRLCKEK